MIGSALQFACGLALAEYGILQMFGAPGVELSVGVGLLFWSFH
jgi:hypothetical protein